MSRSGLDLASLVYNRLVGLPLPPLENYRRGLRLWYPTQDFKAFRHLRREGQLSLWGWLRSIARPQTFPFFRWTDPMPSLANLLLWLKADRMYGWIKRMWPLAPTGRKDVATGGVLPTRGDEGRPNSVPEGRRN